MNRILLKFVLIAIAAILLSCSKSEPDIILSGTTYSIYDDFGFYDGLVEKAVQAGVIQFATIKVTFTIYEYSGNQKIGENVVSNPSRGKAYSFYAKEESEYLIVTVYAYAKNLAKDADREATWYIDKVYHLTKDQNTAIHIVERTPLSNKKPTVEQ